MMLMSRVFWTWWCLYRRFRGFWLNFGADYRYFVTDLDTGDAEISIFTLFGGYREYFSSGDVYIAVFASLVLVILITQLSRFWRIVFFICETSSRHLPDKYLIKITTKCHIQWMKFTEPFFNPEKKTSSKWYSQRTRIHSSFHFKPSNLKNKKKTSFHRILIKKRSTPP